jgi:hypothetical protein
MRNPGKLYFDSEGVQRGYYVYLHRDRATGDVFYVGKGCGKRAWDTSSRHQLWEERVSSLKGGWEVELAVEDLSEIEAFELEAHLVEEHGGPASAGGNLTNWHPGGEDPISIRQGIDLGPDYEEWDQAYCDARNFKDWPRDRQEAAAQQLQQDLQPAIAKIDELNKEAFETGDERLSSSITDLDCILGSHLDTVKDYLRRRASWKDLGISLEETVDDLASEMEELETHHPRVRPLFELALSATRNALGQIDTGNRGEAEAVANRLRGASPGASATKPRKDPTKE